MTVEERVAVTVFEAGYKYRIPHSGITFALGRFTVGQIVLETCKPVVDDEIRSCTVGC